MKRNGIVPSLVDSFLYLGSEITSSGYSSCDIIRRIRLASSWASWTVSRVITNSACPLSCAFTTAVFWRCCCTGPRPGQSWKLTGRSFNPSICAAGLVFFVLFLHEQVYRRTQYHQSEAACIVWSHSAAPSWHSSSHGPPHGSSGSFKNIFLNLSIFPQSQFFCILALGSGQCLLYRLGSGLVLVLQFCALNLNNS